MLLFISVMMAASAAPAADMPVGNPKAGQPANCPATSRYEAMRRGNSSPKAHRLAQLPDADAYKAVYRKIGGCEAPVIVRFGVSGR